ncbi:MAG: helix-turn-helix transcriptional regulator [Oscillospiraceae bacterium]|nr:helix-turn-helix transcriptional regulator [Oscillospiraceae bacterium]
MLETSTDPNFRELKFVPICEGILFAVVRIDSYSWPYVSFPAGDGYLLINYCQDGRCEVELDDSTEICLSSGDLCLSSSKKVASPFSLPTGHYTGLELSLRLEDFRNGSVSVLGSPLDIVAEIPGRFGLDRQSYVSHVSSELRSLFADIYSSALCDNVLFLKSGILKLLLTLSARDIKSKSLLRTSYPKSHGKIAREIANMISDDPSIHYSLAELSDRYGISEGSIKNIFRSVFGVTYSEYVRNIRMRVSMDELSETDNSIADIAAHVGYENQSKFAAAFRRSNGISPLEYRHLHRRGF